MLGKNLLSVYIKWIIFGFLLFFIPLFLSQGMNLFDQTIKTIFGEMNILLFVLIIDSIISLLPLYIVKSLSKEMKDIVNE